MEERVGNLKIDQSDLKWWKKCLDFAMNNTKR